MAASGGEVLQFVGSKWPSMVEMPGRFRQSVIEKNCEFAAALLNATIAERSATLANRPVVADHDGRWATIIPKPASLAAR
jgi:hypothetical protein